MVKHSSISEAYALLGVEQGASMEQVRSAYKQLALRMHPDKNQGNAEATAQFQQLSEAYNVIQKHHTAPEPRRYYPCGHAYHSDEDLDEDFYEDDDDYYFYEDDYDSDFDRMDFFMFFFEEILRGRTGRGYSRTQGPSYHYQTPETPEEYEARQKRIREEKEREAARRAQQKAERKAFEARMREKERKEAEERQRAKAASRKAEAENQRRKAAQTAQAQQKRVQGLRSATFAAARAGDAARVKKGVWEDEVDPSGGEIKQGCENYIVTQPEDRMETLLHIAAYNGDADLVEWLDAHSADPEERNTLGLSAFHIALQRGHIPILKHFFDNYDPKEEDHRGIYDLSPPMSFLSLALESAEPEVLWMILDRHLPTTQDIGNAWTEVTSIEGKQRLLKKMGGSGIKYTEMQNLLMSYGGFTPPLTPTAATHQHTDGPPSPSTTAQHSSESAAPRGGFRPRGRGSHQRFKSNTKLSEHEPSTPTHDSSTDPSQQHPVHGERGRGRGRGPGHNRGRGRSRGRGN